MRSGWTEIGVARVYDYKLEFADTLVTLLFMNYFYGMYKHSHQ